MRHPQRGAHAISAASRCGRRRPDCHGVVLFFGFSIQRRTTITQLSLLPITILVSAATGCGGTKAAAPQAPRRAPIPSQSRVPASIKATTALTVTVN
jgi:hypothetical protein